MKTCLFALSALVIASITVASPVLANESAAPALHELIATGDVRLKVVELNAYQAIKVKLINTTDRVIAVDPTGTALAPANDEQPLALTTPAGWTHERKIVIGPGEAWCDWLRCCCMDENKEEPSELVAYQRATAVGVSDAVYATMRMWQKNPDQDQTEVNNLLWDAQRRERAIEGVEARERTADASEEPDSTVRQ